MIPSIRVTFSVVSHVIKVSLPHTPFSTASNFAIPSGNEEQHLLRVLRQRHRTHYPKTVQAPGCHPPALIRLLLQLQKLLDFFCLSSLKRANNTSRPRCTQYRFDPFFIKYTDFHISGLIVDQITYHFHIFNFF